MLRIYVVSKDRKELWWHKWFILGPLQRARLSSLSPQGRWEGRLNPITWIPNWLFNTNQHSLSSYLGLGINASQASILHKRPSLYPEHKGDKELWLANVNQWRPWGFSHFFFFWEKCLYCFRHPGQHMVAFYKKFLSVNLIGSYMIERGARVKVTVNTCPALYSSQSTFALLCMLCTPG